MDETLRQLGDLLLRSIPTIFIVLVVYAGYTFIVHRPLVRMLAQRREMTLGAMEKARADVAAAEAKTSEYEGRLRDARIAIFKAQEVRRQAAMQARAAAVQQAREQARSRIERARLEIQGEVDTAKDGLQSEAQRIAREIIHALLKSVALAGSPAGGAQ